MFVNRDSTNNKPYVYGMRIYLDGVTPMAELALGDGGRPTGETEIIKFNSIDEREKYVINSYTFIWDERTNDMSFEKFIHNLK